MLLCVPNQPQVFNGWLKSYGTDVDKHVHTFDAYGFCFMIYIPGSSIYGFQFLFVVWLFFGGYKLISAQIPIHSLGRVIF